MSYWNDCLFFLRKVKQDYAPRLAWSIALLAEERAENLHERHVWNDTHGHRPRVLLVDQGPTCCIAAVSISVFVSTFALITRWTSGRSSATGIWVREIRFCELLRVGQRTYGDHRIGSHTCGNQRRQRTIKQLVWSTLTVSLKIEYREQGMDRERRKTWWFLVKLWTGRGSPGSSGKRCICVYLYTIPG